MSEVNNLFPTIGLEVHAELGTESKLFCGCKNDPEETIPNKNICPICMAYPGAVPKLNKKALDYMVYIGYAVGGDIADFSEFDRKHYFYPDIPKGYQISQYKYPIVSKGTLAGVDLTRIHLEEDTAKIAHYEHNQTSLINFNRSSVPLMELVTEPLIKSAEQAVEFGMELQLLLRTLGVTQARMERGEMRVEANISVSDEWCKGTKVEVKNINSFRALRGAIEFEIERQTKVILDGGEVVQETRGWNESNGTTFSQRKKESAEEYRYFPDPDLTKLYLKSMKEYSPEAILPTLPELPKQKRSRYLDTNNLKKDVAEILIRDMELSNLFDKATEQGVDPIWVSNCLTSECGVYIEADREKFFEHIRPLSLNEIYNYYKTGEISSRGVKDILAAIFEKGGDTKQVANDLNIFQNSNESDLEAIAQKVILENEEVVKEYKAGKDKSLNFLVGKVMQRSSGAANPTVSRDILVRLIKG